MQPYNILRLLINRFGEQKISEDCDILESYNLENAVFTCPIEIDGYGILQKIECRGQYDALWVILGDDYSEHSLKSLPKASDIALQICEFILLEENEKDMI